MELIENTTPDNTINITNSISNGNEEIIDQNYRYELTDKIGSEAIQLAARNGISDEQADSFIKVLEGAKSTPYDLVAARAKQLESEVAALDAKQSEAEIALERDRNFALELTSRRQPEIEQAFNNEVNAAKQSQIEAVRNELKSVYSQFESIGAPWPIPQALSPEDRNTLLEMANDQEDPEYTVDFIPVTPMKVQRMNVIVEKARRYIKDNPEVSYQIEYYLREVCGETVTVDDLDQFCYSLNSRSDEVDYRSRITTSLGPEVSGKKIQRELQKDGLVLQYGWRYHYAKNEKGDFIVKRRTRIYRAVESDGLPEKQIFNAGTSLQVEDNWEGVPEEERQIAQANRVEASAVAAVSDISHDMGSRGIEESIQIDPNWVDETTYVVEQEVNRQNRRASSRFNGVYPMDRGSDLKNQKSVRRSINHANNSLTALRDI